MLNHKTLSNHFQNLLPALSNVPEHVLMSMPQELLPQIAHLMPGLTKVMQEMLD